MSAPAPGHRHEKTEKNKATTEIAEVGSDVLRTQLPINMPGLGHVNCYVLEDDRGVALVDPGLPGPQSYRALKARLDEIGIPIRRVHTVVVTHSHPDHYGGAGRIREQTGADIVTFSRFRTAWDPLEEDGDPDVLEHATSEERDAGAELQQRGLFDRLTNNNLAFNKPTPWSGEKYKIGWQRRFRYGVLAAVAHRWFPTPVPSVRLDDADVIRLAGREWVAMHTPGHTPDHLCLYDPTEGIVLSGDHVLPGITPHISGLSYVDDPLKHFISSLDRMKQLEHVTQVLPAHGKPFTNMDERVDDIKRHHNERLDALREAGASLGPASVDALAKQIFKPVAWGPMAESETYAHLEHLRLAGEAEHRSDDGRLIYTIT